MARRTRPSAVPRSFRRTRLFVIANIVLWGVVGGWFLLQPKERQADVSRLLGNVFDARKQVTAFDVAWDLWQLYYSDDFVRVPPRGGRTVAYAGWPEPAGFMGPDAGRVLVNDGYVVGYSDALGNPRWAAYRAFDLELRDAPARPDEFVVDMRTSARVDPGVYSRSGYDRGHLAPNFAIATRYGKRAQEETFRMSNICPQRHALNAGPWKRLEQKVATSYPARFGEVWVLAGPVFGPKPERLKGRVAVPDAFFMIIVDEEGGRARAQAFLFPQDTPAEAPLEGFLVSIDEVERRTGLDFLRDLPDDAEAALEARAVARVW
ncbi:MAG: DNA/RNA non-specific endonuclease [Opitutaceae bacterium]|nr:DNA/RNA non-specific endonuclease [Opitutaceae bacterium]